MSLPHMAWRYLNSRLPVTALTLAGISLGAALVCGVLVLKRESETAFSREAALFDLIAGGKGGSLQLVLSCLYHLDVPAGNIPYSDYERLRRDSRVKWAAPLGVGDNYAGFRIIGTESHFFDLTDRDGRPFLEIVEGRRFEERFEVVLGSEVARSTGLEIGDRFAGTHGLVNVAGSELHDDFPYTVCGILAPTETTQDRAIFGTLESVWEIHETEDRLQSAIQGTATLRPKEPRETTAVLLRLKTPGLRLLLADEIRRRTGGIAAIPLNEIMRLYQGFVAPMQKALLAVASAVVVVSCLTVLATILQAGERRRRDLAILRSLGARPHEVAALMFLEGLLLCAIGLGLGWLLGHGSLALAANWMRESSGLVIETWRVGSGEATALSCIALCCLAASVVPAIVAYRRAPLDDLSLDS
ncbi:MAG: ABC transporter permease [Verrucomicrobiota bacterium]